MACQTVITNVPPAGQAKPASSHNGGGFVRFENCGSWDFWIHDVNANCNSIYNLAKINCIPLIDFLTTPLQVDVDANGHTIYNIGKIFIGSSTDDGSGALLQVNGEINAKSYMLGGYEFASYATPGQIDLTNIYSIDGVTGFLPSGPEGSIQYNDDGNFAGDSFLVYDETTHNVGIVPLGLGPQWRLDVGGDINIIDPTYTGYAYRINGIPFAIADAGGSHINLINIGTINGAPPGSGGGGGAPGGSPGDVQFNVAGGLFGGSNNLFWDNINGRLGIGTNAPAYPLDVRGNENITGCYYIAGVPFACQSGSGIALQNIVTINGGPPGGSSTLPGAPIGSVQYNQGNVFTGSNNLTWDWINNRLGIGTFAPGYPLDVVGNVNARGCYLISGLTFACSDGAGGINLTNITNINGQPPGSGGGGASVTVSDTPPASPSLGNLWFDSIGTQLYIWYTDPNSSQWVATINQCGSGGGGGGEFDPTNVLAGTCMTVDYTTTNVTVNANKACIQTPWVVNEDASNYTLSNVNALGIGAAASSPGIFILRPVGSPLAMNIRGAGPADFSAQIQIINDTNSGLYLGVPGSTFAQPGQPGNAIIRSTNDMLFATTTNTLERARITQAGLVGIGNTAPTYQLDVTSAANAYAARFQNPGTFSGIIVDHTGTAGGESVVSFRSGGTETAVIEYDSDEDNLIFWTGAHDAANATMCCTTNSFVGIGTTSPAAELDVNGCIRSINFVPPASGHGMELAFSNGTGYLTCYDRTAAAYLPMTINGSGISMQAQAGGVLTLNAAGGNVGIGTNSPSAFLNAFYGTNTEPSVTYGAYAAFILNNAGVELAMGCSATAPYPFWMQSRINSNTAQDLVLNPLGGNVGIGATNPLATLHVNGPIHITGGFYPGTASPNSSSLDNYGGSARWQSMGPDTATNGGFQFISTRSDNSHAIFAMIITGSGNVGIGTSNPQVPLDVNGIAACFALGGQSTTSYNACLTVASDRGLPGAPPNNTMSMTYTTSNHILQLVLTDANGVMHTANITMS